MSDFLCCSTVCTHAYYKTPLILSKSGAEKRPGAPFFPLPIAPSYFSFLYFADLIVFFLIIIFMLERVEITQNDISNLFKTSPTMKTIGWLMNIAGLTYYLLVISIIKYLYKINWLKSIGVIIIPVGCIYLLGQFFAKFIF